MEVQIAAAKIRKYATANSGDSVEFIERPGGGVSVVLVDGQGSGRGAKNVSNLVVRKVISLLADGVRDGAAARAASDSLFVERGGKVSATLNIVSVDMQTNTMVITRNNPAPMVIVSNGEGCLLSEPSLPIGFYRGTRPVINEFPLESGLVAVIFSDGLIHAGERTGRHLDILGCVQSIVEGEQPSPQFIADTLLEQALILDDRRPVDDISVVALCVVPAAGDEVRRMGLRLPLHS